MITDAMERHLQERVVRRGRRFHDDLAAMHEAVAIANLTAIAKHLGAGLEEWLKARRAANQTTEATDESPRHDEK